MSPRRMATDAEPGRPARPPRQKSLRARALGYLARREHSRTELARKLAPHAADADELTRLLNALEADRLLSDERFVGSLARTRGERYGAAWVRQVLRTHDVDEELVRSAVAELQRTEFTRARAVWQRRFGAPAADPTDRGRQMRFLAGRGFSESVIRRVVRGAEE